MTQEQFTIKGIKVGFPIIKECHCGNIADKYMCRKYTNQLNQLVVRVFYRCRNCWSRVSEDFISESDSKNSISVQDILKKYR